MKIRALALISFLLMVLQFFLPKFSLALIPVLLLILLYRNSSGIKGFLKFLLPSLVFIMLVYSLMGQFMMGLLTILLLSGTSFCLQLYLLFFPDLSLYALLKQTGCPERIAFIIYGAVNYTLFIKPIILEIQDAQRLRGIDIPKGIRGLISYHTVLIPLMVRLLKGADHLAESLYLRSSDRVGDHESDSKLH